MDFIVKSVNQERYVHVYSLRESVIYFTFYSRNLLFMKTLDDTSFIVTIIIPSLNDIRPSSAYI